MSKPTQWTTTYSTVFRDRRKYDAPDPRPSDDSWNVRTQAYYGTRAALSEHAARTAEVEARTAYGSKPLVDAQAVHLAARQGGSLTAGRAGASAYNPSTGGGSASSPNPGAVRYAHPQKDLWTHPILPHTGTVQNGVPVIAGVTSPVSGAPFSSSRAVFHNGYNNGYATIPSQWAESPSYPPESQAEHVPQSHIPGYQGFIRGAQFLHGDTYGKTTRQCLSNPTEVPLEP